ncbi:hypothetical protein ACUXST_001752 [Sphingomonas sp. F9_3S_D5_B_2]
MMNRVARHTAVLLVALMVIAAFGYSAWVNLGR